MAPSQQFWRVNQITEQFFSPKGYFSIAYLLCQLQISQIDKKHNNYFVPKYTLEEQ